MAVSVIEICNNALLDLGEETIMSLSDDSKPARLCNQRWPGVRDAVLRAHPWNCCTAQAVLAADAAPPAWRRSFAYPLPPDCLRLVRVAGPDGRLLEDWEVQGRALSCDSPAPLLVDYVRRETDPAAFDALLSETLSARLSAVLAYPLTASTSLAQALWKVYEDKLTEARGADAREAGSPPPSPAAWLSAKLGGR
ncbi:hypothetical protein [Desulfovibrio aminophilus]|uniref:hypothetical protein n=1 Tax=Desulfovibrio aminophilus TaxID=81425 RepID=UPI003394C3B8